ncbi:MAG: mannitol dehydrogenase family protein [Lachnospiraceae bacterium]|nr:mannitol dehydrogenase family protein [Lachnospiraceae bacterium]
MKLVDIVKPENRAEWEAKGYALPQYDRDAMIAKTKENPTWIHFGAGNIFRAFPAAVLEGMLNRGEADTGVIVAEGFDYDIIDMAYRPFDNYSLLVVLKADGSIEKRVVGSVAESLKADTKSEDFDRLAEIFRKESLQMVTFTITEKGYSLWNPDGSYNRFAAEDFSGNGLKPQTAMGKVTALLYERFKAGACPITMSSMDNCSHNGDKLKKAILTYATEWCKQRLVPPEFLRYLEDESKVAFPWSMIDKITPRPDAKVQEMLAADGFTDNNIIITGFRTYTAPFVNAEETEYLVVEDTFTNGRPALEKGGVLYTDRETVDKVEKMKVCTCLNPLHTALAIYGCLLGYTLISEEMKDPQLCKLVTRMGYEEAMPVVVNPGILKPEDFIGAVLTKRLPNPFMPDAPQRIATDTSQKLPIRFGETLKAYSERGLAMDKLTLIPLVLAGYARYLRGLDDNGNAFEQSPDPLLTELSGIVSDLSLSSENDWSVLSNLYSRKDVFGVDLYELGLGERIEALAKELFAGAGAVRATLCKYLG